jgi:hypothetical protein
MQYSNLEHIIRAASDVLKTFFCKQNNLTHPCFWWHTTLNTFYCGAYDEFW